MGTDHATSASAWIFPALTAAFGLSAFISGYAVFPCGYYVILCVQICDSGGEKRRKPLVLLHQVGHLREIAENTLAKWLYPDFPKEIRVSRKNCGTTQSVFGVATYQEQ